MKIFAELTRIRNLNGQENFRIYRERNLGLITRALAVAGSILVFLWHLTDHLFFPEKAGDLFLIRTVTILIFFGVFFLAGKLHRKMLKVVCYGGFYAGALFSAVIAQQTGGIASNYWIVLNLMITVLFIVAPFAWYEVVVHALAFILIYNLFPLAFPSPEQSMAPATQINIYFISTFLVGIIITVSRNLSDADSFLTLEKLNKYVIAIEQAPGSVIISDVEGRIEYVNPYFTKLSEHPAEDVIGTQIGHILNRQEHDLSFEKIREHLRTNGTFRGEFENNTKSGIPFWVRTVVAPFMNTLGEISGFVSMAQDITEQKKMQQALEESETKYRNIVEQSLDGITITQDGRFVFVNRAFCDMLGYTSGEIYSLWGPDLIVPEDRERLLDIARRRLQGEQFTMIHRTTFIKKNGDLLHVEMNSTSILYNGIRSSYVTVRDVTDRIKSEEQLKHAKAELEQLNRDLESKIIESTDKLTRANTRLLNLEKENLQTQFEMLKQQVNPHFLFNSLNVLTSLIKLDPDLAEKFTEQLSKVYRYVLENKERELVSVQTELEFLNAYLFLLDIRFRDKLHIDIRIPDDRKEFLILPLALQLLIENAIKHNTLSKRSPLIIEVTVDGENFLQITNNLQMRDSHFASTGVGLANIVSRYSLLTDLRPEFRREERLFVARIPLLEGES